jgi:hypothetical protein
VNTIEQGEEESDEEFYVDMVETMNLSDSDKYEWLVNLTLFSRKKQVPFKIDSGAQVNCLPETIYNDLQKKPPIILKPKIKLKTYNKQEIPLVGACWIKIKVNNKWKSVQFMVVKGNRQPILGLATSIKLGYVNIPEEHFLQRCVDNIKKQTELSKDSNDASLKNRGDKPKVELKDISGEALRQEIKNRFPKLFEGLGRFEEPYSIKLKEGYRPAIHPMRKVPLAYKNRIIKELDRMEKLGVISKVSVPTEFVNSMVATRKKGTDEIRICLDPKDLNDSVMREHYYMKTREEILAELGNPKYFSELDLRHAYWQIQLDEKSRLLTTFNTPKGRYCFNVCPFGLNSISEVCQKRVEENITEKVDGTFPYQDNVFIVADTIEQHDRRLLETLDKCKEAGITLNFPKCKLRVPSIVFLGEKLSEQGIEPDPEKVSTILDWETPKNVTELQAFFGMLNFVGKFIPNLSARTSALRSLLKKGAAWMWDANHEQEFQDMKKAMTAQPVLAYYDPSKEHMISSDASKDGIGTVLLQKEEDGWHPVHYGAKSLNKTEKNYVPIEREALGQLFGAKKFHQYIFGKHFRLQTDHRPLVSIFEGYLNEAPSRIQGIMLKLQKYDFKIEWVPRKYIQLADGLSKYANEKSGDDLSKEVEFHVNEVKLQVPVSDSMWSIFKNETDKDTRLCQLRDAIQEGKILSEFKSIQSKLSVLNGIIFMTNRVFVPESLRKQMLEKIHEGCLGREKCKRRARSCLYWPKMGKQIDEWSDQCSTCCKFREKQRKEPLIQDIQEHPWHKVGTDIYTLGTNDYLIVIDYMSNYPEVAQIKNKDAKTVINTLKPIFARHGIPGELTSDNVPFTSHAFLEFALDYGFKYSPISPRDSNANGKAEMGVKIIKKLMRKAYDTKGDINLAILNYRATPLENGLSPAEMLMGRKIRTRLPMLLRDKPDDELMQKVLQIRDRQKFNYDRGAKELKVLKKGDTVRLINDEKKGAMKMASVIDSPSQRSYRIVTEDNNILRRNRNFLIKTPEIFTLNPELEIDTSSQVEVSTPSNTSQNQINTNNGTNHETTQTRTHNTKNNNNSNEQTMDDSKSRRVGKYNLRPR